MMFEGFALDHVDVGQARLRVRHGGAGPPVLLLHGHPRTHATWHQVAPLLAGNHTIVCPDLRGHGQSSKPETTLDHAPYSKRAMARAAVSHLAVLDGIPIGEALARVDARFASLWWHWFFLGQSAKPAERIINADPDAWYGGRAQQMGAEAYEDYRQAIHDPATVHGMREDYRAGLGRDRAADDADKATGRRITCPVLFLWSTRDDMFELYDDPIAIWREWADDVRGQPIDSGHHMAEGAQAELAAALAMFLKS